MLNIEGAGITKRHQITGLACVLSLAAVLVALISYCITYSMIALSFLHVCFSIALLTILAPFMLNKCREMVKCTKGEETGSMMTKIMCFVSLLMMYVYCKRLFVSPSPVVPQFVYIACAVIDFVPMFLVPAAWLICRAYEDYIRNNSFTPDLPNEMGSEEVFRENRRREKDGDTFQLILQLVGQLANQSPDQRTVTPVVISREAYGEWQDESARPPQVFDEVEEVLRRQGIRDVNGSFSLRV